MRDRICARFAQLEDERTATRAQLDHLTTCEGPQTDPPAPATQDTCWDSPWHIPRVRT